MQFARSARTVRMPARVYRVSARVWVRSAMPVWLVGNVSMPVPPLMPKCACVESRRFHFMAAHGRSVVPQVHCM